MNAPAVPGLRVLGDFELVTTTGPVALGSARHRRMLALLSLHAGTPIAADELADIGWPHAAATRSALHTAVTRLRHHLHAAGVDGHLERSHDAYRLTVEPTDLDLLDFRRSVAHARGAAAEGRFRRAERWYARAMALVRGPVLADQSELAVHPLTGAVQREVTAAALDHAHVAALAERPAAALEVLCRLVAIEPLDERLVATLMTVLAGVGRRSDALEHYRALRQRLRDELGIEPDVRLVALQRQILRGRPTPVGTLGGAASTPVVPAQLPAPTLLVGRDDEVARAVAHLDAEPLLGGRVVIIAGAPGSGKTSLALHVAHRARARFPDGQLFAGLGGTSGEPLHPADVLARFLRAVLGADAPVPADPDERAAALRSALDGRRALIVLDDAASADQVVRLLPGSSTCAVLITSRASLLPAGSPLAIELGPLADCDAVALLRRHARIAGTADDDGAAGGADDAAAAVVLACGGLPLALRIIGGRLAQHPRWTMREVARRLTSSRHRLDELQLGDASVRESFRQSYDNLDADLARCFALLAAWPATAFDDGIASALFDTAPRRTRQLLERLVAVHLLERPDPDCYRLPDLLHEFAAETMARSLPRAEIIARLGAAEAADARALLAEARPA